MLLLGAGSRVFAILIRALNISCGLDEIYGFFHRLLLECGMFLFIGFLFIGAILSHLLVPLLGDVLSPLPFGKGAAFALLGRVVPAILLLCGFFCMYKFVPRQRGNWQRSLLASGAATTLSLGARPLFVAYVGELASYRPIYGWLAVGIVLLLWTQILAAITLYCGELASHIQMMAYDGLTGEEVSRMHRARAPGRSAEKEGAT